MKRTGQSGPISGFGENPACFFADGLGLLIFTEIRQGPALLVPRARHQEPGSLAVCFHCGPFGRIPPKLAIA
jgi:hypothetical protein